MNHGMGRSSGPLPEYSVEWGRAPVVERATWLGEGDFCTCYLVNGAYVFRFAKHAEASAAMRAERCLLPVLGEHLAVGVPRVEFGGRRDDTGQALMGYLLLPGAPLDRDILERLPPASGAALISQVADFARQLHGLPLEVIDPCTLKTLHPLTHLTGVVDRARAAIWPRLTGPVRRYHEDLLALYAEDPMLHTYPPALLHGDLSPDHLLADTGRVRLTGVIDFGDACIGDPAWDLVYIYEDYGPDVLSLFLDRYDPRNARLIGRKVRIYQQLNNVDYCLQVLSSGDEGPIREAMAILDEQALAGGA